MIRSYQKGFALIEVIVIIIIVGLLGAIAIPKYISLTKAAERGNVESVWVKMTLVDTKVEVKY